MDDKFEDASNHKRVGWFKQQRGKPNNEEKYSVTLFSNLFIWDIHISNDIDAQ